MGRHRADAPKQSSRHFPRGRQAHSQRHLLVLRSGAPWRELPESYCPHTTCYNRFVRWRRAGVLDQIMDALAGAHDVAVQIIDTSVVARAPTRKIWPITRGTYEQDTRRRCGRQ
jgi:transposase